MPDGQVTQDDVRVLYQAKIANSINRLDSLTEETFLYNSMNSKQWLADPRRLELQTIGVYEW